MSKRAVQNKIEQQAQDHTHSREAAKKLAQKQRLANLSNSQPLHKGPGSEDLYKQELNFVSRNLSCEEEQVRSKTYQKFLDSFNGFMRKHPVARVLLKVACAAYLLLMCGMMIGGLVLGFVLGLALTPTPFFPIGCLLLAAVGGIGFFIGGMAVMEAYNHQDDIKSEQSNRQAIDPKKGENVFKNSNSQDGSLYKQKPQADSRHSKFFTNKHDNSPAVVSADLQQADGLSLAPSHACC